MNQKAAGLRSVSDVFSAADCDHSRRADGNIWCLNQVSAASERCSSVLLWRSRTVLFHDPGDDEWICPLRAASEWCSDVLGYFSAPPAVSCSLLQLVFLMTSLRFRSGPVRSGCSQADRQFVHLSANSSVVQRALTSLTRRSSRSRWWAVWWVHSGNMNKW